AHRLDRLKSGKFGDSEYAFEELVAELSAAFTCAATGITSTPRPDHAQYIASWLKALKSEKRFIFEAAKHAGKATDYITGETVETGKLSATA
ncbi:MAG TPA: zincin-like metallopeptidase domain-containing protein, partial [Candidatus Paceibacterota bacterium]|nr:zincin-like metallopeptidase domain-containing protein [Candidatus Paceibacterota bacterium]